MNIANKDQFAKAFEELDATNEPEAIRNLIDQDEHREAMQSKSGRWYLIESGTLKQLEV